MTSLGSLSLPVGAEICSTFFSSLLAVLPFVSEISRVFIRTFSDEEALRFFNEDFFNYDLYHKTE